MRIFVAGATGVIGIRLVPLLVAAGHEVAGMTRSPGKVDQLRAIGADPVVCDVYDAETLRGAVIEFEPDIVVHQLTDLPDDAARISEFSDRNDRIRLEGTRNLLGAAEAAKVQRILVQSIAWELPGKRGETTREFERSVLNAGGVVIRYGQLYGPGTYYEDAKPDPPRISVDDAARRTVEIIDAPPSQGIVDVVD